MFTNSAKKTFTLLCTLMLALVFVGTSCKKDDEKTLKDLLTAHAWKQTGEKLGGTSQPIDACTADDIVEFSDDNKYHFDEGATKCDESDPQETYGTWSISESTTPATLTITYTEDGSTETLEWKLTELTSSKLVMTSEEFPIIGAYELIFEKK